MMNKKDIINEIKKFDCLDKNYMSKKERRLYTIIYSLILMTTAFITLILRIDLMFSIGIIFLEGATATLILYLVCRQRTKKHGNVC